jgi:hypothetical protein
MIHQNKVTMRPYLHDEICKITHTHILQSSLIHQNEVTMWPYLHNEICKITHTHRSCSQVIDLATRGHWISSISIDGLENWFLASNETTKLSNEGPIRATREGGGEWMGADKNSSLRLNLAYTPIATPRTHTQTRSQTGLKQPQRNHQEA